MPLTHAVAWQVELLALRWPDETPPDAHSVVPTPMLAELDRWQLDSQATDLQVRRFASIPLRPPGPFCASVMDNLGLYTFDEKQRHRVVWLQNCNSQCMLFFNQVMAAGGGEAIIVAGTSSGALSVGLFDGA